MNIYQVIENDHELTRGLLTRIAAARNPEWRYQLCRELAQVVHVQARCKQIAFYAAFKQFPEIRLLLSLAEEEHDIAEILLKEALNLDPEDQQFMRLFQKAHAELEQQMQYEKDEIFRRTRAVLAPAQAVQIGQRLRALRDEFIEADYMSSTSLRADAGYYS